MSDDLLITHTRHASFRFSRRPAAHGHPHSAHRASGNAAAVCENDTTAKRPLRSRPLPSERSPEALADQRDRRSVDAKRKWRREAAPLDR